MFDNPAVIIVLYLYKVSCFVLIEVNKKGRINETIRKFPVINYYISKWVEYYQKIPLCDDFGNYITRGKCDIFII